MANINISVIVTFVGICLLIMCLYDSKSVVDPTENVKEKNVRSAACPGRIETVTVTQRVMHPILSTIIQNVTVKETQSLTETQSMTETQFLTETKYLTNTETIVKPETTTSTVTSIQSETIIRPETITSTTTSTTSQTVFLPTTVTETSILQNNETFTQYLTPVNFTSTLTAFVTSLSTVHETSTVVEYESKVVLKEITNTVTRTMTTEETILVTPTRTLEPSFVTPTITAPAVTITPTIEASPVTTTLSVQNNHTASLHEAVPVEHSPTKLNRKEVASKKKEEAVELDEELMTSAEVETEPPLPTNVTVFSLIPTATHAHSYFSASDKVNNVTDGYDKTTTGMTTPLPTTEPPTTSSPHHYQRSSDRQYTPKHDDYQEEEDDDDEFSPGIDFSR